MMKSKILFTLRIFVILIAALFILQSPGSAGILSEDQAAQSVYIPLISNSYVYEKPVGDSVIQGIISDGRTGALIDGAEVCLVGTGICEESNINGMYALTEVPPGGYTLIATHPNYAEFSDELNIIANANVTFDITLMPVLEDGQWRIVLTWDSTPSWPPHDVPNNLDLHLWLRDSEDYHIYEGNLGNCNNMDVFPHACYESEVQYGSGPDTIVFADKGDRYTIAVLHYFDEYDGVPPIEDLNARLQIYDSTGLRATYDVKNARGDSGDLWFVLDLWDKQIESQNCLLQYDNQDGTPPSDCP